MRFSLSVLSYRSLFAALIVTSTLSFAGSAWAQEDTGTDGIMTTSSTSTTTTALTTAVGVVVTVYMTPKPNRAALQHYLESNQPTVQLALSAGAGASVEDLAEAFRVSPAHVADFGKLLRENHEPLLKILRDGHVSDAEADEFVRVIHDAMRTHERLAQDLNAQAS